MSQVLPTTAGAHGLGVKPHRDIDVVLFLLTVGVIGGAMLIMAVGLAFKYPCLRGSCGGADVLTADGRPLTCDVCPRRRGRSAT